MGKKDDGNKKNFDLRKQKAGLIFHKYSTQPIPIKVLGNIKLIWPLTAVNSIKIFFLLLFSERLKMFFFFFFS